MQDTKTLKDQLTNIFNDYVAALPSKIQQIQIIIDSLNKNSSEGSLKDLHLKTHSLGGSAGTYGYEKLGLLAKDLSHLVETHTESNAKLDLQQVDAIFKLIQESYRTTSREQALEVFLQKNLLK